MHTLRRLQNYPIPEDEPSRGAAHSFATHQNIGIFSAAEKLI